MTKFLKNATKTNNNKINLGNSQELHEIIAQNKHTLIIIHALKFDKWIKRAKGLAKLRNNTKT